MKMAMTIHFVNGDVKKFEVDADPDNPGIGEALGYFHKEHLLVLELDDDKTMMIPTQSILYTEISPHAKRLSPFAIKNVKAVG